MKLELIANVGDEPVALFAQEASARQVSIAMNIADRLFGVSRVSYDAQLSYRWSCSVYCTAEFSTWWRSRPGAPTPVQRIFLEVHAA